jgi:hypothetical protein
MAFTISSLLSSTAYIKVSKNHFNIRHVESGTEIESVSTKGFTTQRLLVGDFQEAEKILKTGIRKLMGEKFFAPSPAVVIHPIEMVEGGLSSVEHRVFQELAIASGARSAKVHVGASLTDAMVKELCAIHKK